LISIKAHRNGPLSVTTRISVSIDARREDQRVRSHLFGPGCRGPADLRRLCGPAEARLTMLMILIYAAGGVAIAIYMIAALLRPEKF
jgi:hypothetical protein